MIRVGQLFHDGANWAAEFLCCARSAMSKDDLIAAIGCRVRAHHYRCILSALSDTLDELAIGEVVCSDPIGDEGRVQEFRIEIDDRLAGNLLLGLRDFLAQLARDAPCVA